MPAGRGLHCGPRLLFSLCSQHLRQNASAGTDERLARPILIGRPSVIETRIRKAGLNLQAANTVINVDLPWNPAVLEQRISRVHRMGQKKNVSAYKLITLNTIEEKIAEMQKRKKGLVKKVVSCDDEAIAKLTWEDVLELLKT